MSFSTPEMENSAYTEAFSYDDEYDFDDVDFDDDFEEYDEEDEELDEFDDEEDLYYDDVFKAEDDIDEPFDDVEPEDGYNMYVPAASEELMADDELTFDDGE